MTLDDDALGRALDFTKLQTLLGRVPRHVMDAELTRDVLDERYEDDFRKLVQRA